MKAGLVCMILLKFQVEGRPIGTSICIENMDMMPGSVFPGPIFIHTTIAESFQGLPCMASETGRSKFLQVKIPVRHQVRAPQIQSKHAIDKDPQITKRGKLEHLIGILLVLERGIGHHGKAGIA